MFEITEDNLRRKSEIKSLKLCNNSYDVTFFYYGEYAEDMGLKGICDAANLSMSCKVKGDALPVMMMEGKLFIDVADFVYLSMEKAAEYRKKFETAYESVCELAKIIKQYFGLDAASV